MLTNGIVVLKLVRPKPVRPKTLFLNFGYVIGLQAVQLRKKIRLKK